MPVFAELKSLDSVDVPTPRWEDWRGPDDPACFALQVTAGVGPKGEEGCEWFDFTVCTPAWIAADERLPKAFAFGRYLLVVRWDPAVIDRAIGDLIRRTSGDSWHDVALKLSRFARWEFEDYQPFDGA